jgi:hypothetical protein
MTGPVIFDRKESREYKNGPGSQEKAQGKAKKKAKKKGKTSFATFFI